PGLHASSGPARPGAAPAVPPAAQVAAPHALLALRLRLVRGVDGVRGLALGARVPICGRNSGEQGDAGEIVQHRRSRILQRPPKGIERFDRLLVLGHSSDLLVTHVSPLRYDTRNRAPLMISSSVALTTFLVSSLIGP